MKILLLEDEVMLQCAIAEYLSDLGHLVDTFVDGEEAFEHLMSESYDLCLFDINVPSLSGLELLESLQKSKIYTPTIFISAITDIEEISQSYALGCFAYLKKPFHLKELGILIERLLKTCKIEPKEQIRLSRFYRFDFKAQHLLFDGIPQTLTKKQTQIITLLAQNLGRFVSYEVLREYVWDNEIVDNATIRTEINRTKKALKEDLILNIRGLGYKIDKPKILE